MKESSIQLKCDERELTINVASLMNTFTHGSIVGSTFLFQLGMNHCIHINVVFAFAGQFGSNIRSDIKSFTTILAWVNVQSTLLNGLGDIFVPVGRSLSSNVSIIFFFCIVVCILSIIRSRLLLLKRIQLKILLNNILSVQNKTN